MANLQRMKVDGSAIFMSPHNRSYPTYQDLGAIIAPGSKARIQNSEQTLETRRLIAGRNRRQFNAPPGEDALRQPQTIDWQSKLEAWEQDIKQRIDSLSNLRDDWDFFGAQPVKQSAIDQLKEFIHYLCRHSDRKLVLSEPRISPGVDGSASITWRGPAYSVRVIASSKLPDVMSYINDEIGLVEKQTGLQIAASKVTALVLSEG